MRFLLILALVSMMAFSSLAVTRKAMVAEMPHDGQKRQLGGDDQEQNDNANGSFKNTDENHHTIPRKDFDKYMGNNNNNGNGSG
ncbi:hypothetical protein TIFTF001_000722 [Ficus carica]|uniref:Uncharacterized protein n=1 Tax=Ficus carica TaxID=3494 RepID=A0AA87YYF3_FICCA|nr:hypothetical protein TIFTF001_000722 [Ficus carica]